MRKTSFSIFIIGILALIFSFNAAAVLAAGETFTGKLESPINATSFEALVGGVTKFIFWVAMALAPLMFLIAGFYIITAGGDPNKVTTGRKIMIYTAIGLAVIMFARGLVAVLQNVLGVK